MPLIIVFSFFVGLVAFRGQIVSSIRKEQFKNAPEATELLSKSYLSRVTSSDGKFHPEETTAQWFNREVPAAPFELAAMIMQNPVAVLGENTSDKWIEINLNTQRLYAHEGDRIVFEMPVSTGLPWMPTVTGDFRIWAKVRAQRMSGGSQTNGTYYNLPNVPFVQYFHGAYGLHGAYWHNDFGKPRSHGCVNLSIPDAEKLFYWTSPQLSPSEYARYSIKPEDATRIVVHGNTPTNIY